MSTADAWITEKVNQYKKDRPRYERYKKVLQEILGHARRRYAPLAEVQARTKEVPSFAEKMLLKRQEHGDDYWPTDLCGARVIAHTPGEVEAVCDFIRSHFTVDKDNSLDAAERLRAREFGYRSFHYVVELPGQFPTPEVAVTPPADVCGLKAEIQVRTIAQHCWADIGHDRIYKGTLKDRLPKEWDRESGRLAALLETVDGAFARLVEALQSYESPAGLYMSKPQLQKRLNLLEAVRRHGGGADDEGVLLKIARVALALEEWDHVIALLSDPPPRAPALLFCLGLATCRRHRPGRPGRNANLYRRGKAWLAQAADEGRDVEARTALADTWLAEGKTKEARAAYEQAFRQQPTHPRATGGYARLTVGGEKGLGRVDLIRPALEAAARTCRNQVAVEVNLPGALYSLGELLMLLREPYAALTAYARAVRISAREGKESQIDAALADLKPYVSPEFEWARRLLRLGRAVRFSGDPRDEVKGLATPSRPAFDKPVVIVAGGCDPTVQQRIEGYRRLLTEAFRDFRGTVISGGTTAGVSGLVGALTDPKRLRTLSYLPRTLPAGAVRDERYSKVLRTEGSDFSPLQPLQSWTDLVAAGVAPSEVKLLGINGGAIAAFEYRLALTLGASVGVLRDSGREASRLVADEEWETADGLAFLPADLATLRSFLAPPSPARFGAADRERLAEAFHETHRKETAPLPEWRQLSKELKQSNLALVDHIDAKLREVGLEAYEVTGRKILLFPLDEKKHVEPMAELEHGRWNAERLRDGWRLGPKDTARKISPYLVAWADLPDDIKEWDRQLVREIPEKLRQVGWEVGPVGAAPPAAT